MKSRGQTINCARVSSFRCRLDFRKVIVVLAQRIVLSVDKSKSKSNNCIHPILKKNFDHFEETLPLGFKCSISLSLSLSLSHSLSLYISLCIFLSDSLCFTLPFLQRFFLSFFLSFFLLQIRIFYISSIFYP